MGYSGKQLPSGMVSTGPCLGPPESSISSGLLSVGAGLLVVVGGGLLGEGLLVVVGAGLLVVVGAGDALPPPTAAATGVKSVVWSSYSVVSQAMPSSGPSSSSSTSGSEGSARKAAFASPWDRKCSRSRPTVGLSSFP